MNFAEIEKVITLNMQLWDQKPYFMGGYPPVYPLKGVLP